MQVGIHYNIFGAEFVTTRLGSIVAVHLRDERNPVQTYYLYLPKRYAKAFTQKYIEDINSDRVW
jgi:chemotaxis receptor (MCP) glutamine deamidase CheD